MEGPLSLDWDGLKACHFIIVEIQERVGVNLHATITIYSHLNQNRGCRLSLSKDTSKNLSSVFSE